jgi:putative ABC transport system ATP-binding protein
MDENLTRYIWKHTRVQQFWILSIVALSMIPYYMSFNLPKEIVNGPIQGEGFANPEDTQLFLRIAFDLPWVGEVTLFPGMQLDRLDTLFALSFVFLLLVIVNGWFKFYINTYKGRLGERLLRRLRYTLVDHVLRFPPTVFKRLKAAEVSSMVKDEVEPIGGFTGDAFVSPALLGGQALTALTFIFVQSVPLGLITLSLVLVQVFIIPRMRRRLLVLGRERQLTARELAGRVSEIFDGIGTIHAYDTTNYERADISARLGRIFKIRFDIYQWKFLVKFINNFLASVTPFLFYAVGGYLALNGRLDIGQLVAVIGAYKDLPGPLKELIDWDQNRQDVIVKYQTVTQQFAVDQLIDPDLQRISSETAVGKLLPPLATTDLGVIDESGALTLERVNFTLQPGERVAVVGNSGSGGDVLAEVLARAVWPSSGRATAGDVDLLTLPESVAGRAITYVGPDGYFFYGTVRENLLYALKNAPFAEPTAPLSAADQAHRDWERREAKLAGNPDFDLAYEWIDYPTLGMTAEADLMAEVIKVLDAVGLSRDVLRFALRSTVEVDRYPGFADKVVTMRQVLREELAQENLSDLIIPFEPGAFNVEATVLENMLFGTSSRAELSMERIGENPYFRSVLKSGPLGRQLFDMGVEIARNAIELFADLPPDHPFFQQLTFMRADEIPDYQSLLQKIDAGSAKVTETERDRFILLSFDYVEPRYRFGLMSEALMAEVVEFRNQFHSGMPSDLRDGFHVYDPDQYIASSRLLDNLLFGRISQKYRDGSDRIYAAVERLLTPLGIHDTALVIGLDFHLGAGGKRLSSVQRQKLGMARALLRRSDYYIFNRPLSAIDSRSQVAIAQEALALLSADGRNPAILWVLSQPAASKFFDRIVVFDRGKLVEDGTHADLAEKNGIFKELITA